VNFEVIMTTKLIRLNCFSLSLLATISVSSLLLGGGSVLANPGDYAIQPVCPSTPDPSGTICYTPQTAPVLKMGSRGKLVSIVQGSMKALGYLKATPNGIYGTQTRTAVMQFQRANRITPDGVIGASTWRAILRANAG
jgi:hypothetical protein